MVSRYLFISVGWTVFETKKKFYADFRKTKRDGMQIGMVGLAGVFIDCSIERHPGNDDLAIVDCSLYQTVKQFDSN